METIDDFSVDQDFSQYLKQHPKCVEWDAHMRTYQEKLSVAREDEWWAMMEQVYELKE